MKKNHSTWKYLPLPLIVFSLGGWLSWAQAVKSTPKNPPSSEKQSTAVANPGERAFQANCARCHTPPEQLSPRITGSVLRHMRVRALLSPQDERDILKFLNP